MSSAEHQNKRQKTSHKNHYGKGNRRQFLEPGHHGFLATCNFNEKDCIRECYNLLNQYADELYGKEELQQKADTNESETAQAENNELDIADMLQQQIDAVKPQHKSQGKDFAKKRFQAVDTGAKNCVFIRTTVADPVELGKRIIDDIANTRQQKCRFLLRLVPIETVCRANITDILNAAGQLFDKHFLKEPASFSIIYNKRYNNDIARDTIIGELAKIVSSKNIGNRVDLKQAQKTVIVEVIKGLCCLSVVECYLQNKKYNLIELANAKNGSGDDKDTKASDEDAIKSKDDVVLANETETDNQVGDNNNVNK